MRRFVRSYSVKRAHMVTVVKDTAARTFEVWLWTLQDGAPHSVVGTFPYPADKPSSHDPAQAAAIGSARRIAADLAGKASDVVGSHRPGEHTAPREPRP